MRTINTVNGTKLSCFNVSLSEQEVIAKYLREKSWQIVANAQSGHLGGTSSSVELMTALYFGGHLNVDLNNNTNANHDKVLVRGHLGPLRYGIFNLLGWVEDGELESYRKLGSRLQGHEKMGVVTGIDITPSGALGMVLSYGVGSAINAKVEKLAYKSFVFIGDGEEQEGNISEAARHAASMKLNNLICIIDKNDKQLSRPTKDVDSSDLRSMWRGYGWKVFEINDGHDLEEINLVYKKILNISGDKPMVIIAHTIKGKGLPGAMESANGYHTVNAMGVDTLKAFLSDLEISDSSEIKKIIFGAKTDLINIGTGQKPTEINKNDFRMDEHFGESIEGELALFFKRSANLMEKGYPLYVMTADLITWDETVKYGLCGKERYIDVGIREQHLFALAHGLSVSNPEARIVIKIHDAFLYRAADQIQAINLGGSSVIAIGDYGGLSGCYNGETHESVGQLGTVLTMSKAIVFEPSDAIDFWKIINYVLTENPGLVYIRLYSRGSKILPRIDSQDWYYRTYEPLQKPKLILVSTGLTANESLEAGKQLDEEGIPTRVINVVQLSAIQTLDFVKLFEPDIPVLTVYNGNPFILQSLISTALMSLFKTGKSRVMGHGFVDGESGTMENLKELFGLDPKGIIKRARELL
jgi:transketolase